MANFKNEFSWSKSRAEMFDTCRRKYYLNYYGSWNGWLDYADPEVREIYIMKKLSSIPMWIGSCVHEMAEWVIEQLNYDMPVGLEKTASLLREKMLRDWEDSRSGAYRQRPSKILGLGEHYYKERLSITAFEDSYEIAEKCLYNLFNKSIYQDVLHDQQIKIVMSESFEHFYLDGTKIWVVPDLVISKNGEITIVDWKTGQNFDGGTAEVQLGIYALYGTRKWDCAPESITVHEANLRHGESAVKQISKKDMEWVTRYILNSVTMMRVVLDDPDKNIASIENFPKRDDQGLCRYCNFRRACER
jgi:hypothetical protein